MDSETKTIKFVLEDVPKLFNMDHTGNICARDIIAYARAIVKDPWTKVILDYDKSPVEIGELEEAGIFWKGNNEDRLVQSFGVGVRSYCIVNASELNDTDEDCGLNKVISEFKQAYDIYKFVILVVGINDSDRGGTEYNRLVKLHSYIVNSGHEDVIFPNFLVRQNKLFEDGLDISVYTEKIEKQRQRNSLDAEYLTGILNEISQKIKRTTAIQDLKEFRTPDVKILSTYLALKYNLPPVYVFSFLTEYQKYTFYFPFTKLSLYERFVFIRGLPPLVGYIGKNQDLTCIADVLNKVFPNPHYVFDIDNHKLVEDVDSFKISAMRGPFPFADYRRMFPESQDALVLGRTSMQSKTAMVAANQSDDLANRRLVDMFTEFTSLVENEPIYLSIKNTILLTLNGKRYMLYCPEEGVVTLKLKSEYFNSHVMNIPESEFFRLIDAQITRALLTKARAKTMAEGSTALVELWYKIDTRYSMRPAIPLEVSLYMNILPLVQNGLSYYDRLLRCHKDVLPIITSLDATYESISPLFKEIPLENLRRDPQARYAITAFGTLADEHINDPKLPVTYNAFRDRRLLE